MGRSSIDLYAHQIGVPITDVTSFDAYVGGCPTNISVGTRRLGLRSALLTAVGDDQVGDFVLAFLDREGVETAFIPRKPGRRTSAVIMAIQPPDRFPLTFYREDCADRELTIDDVVRAPIAESRDRGRHRHRAEPRAEPHSDALRRRAGAAAGRAGARRHRLPSGSVAGARRTIAAADASAAARARTLAVGTEEEVVGGRRRRRAARGDRRGCCCERPRR